MTKSAGVTLAIPLLTKSLSGEDKTMPAAITYIVLSVGGALGSILGTVIAHTNVRHTFLISFAARMTGAFLIFLVMVHRPLAPERSS